jgi:hypothetical protein
MADFLIGGLGADPALTLGINEPYSPADHVLHGRTPCPRAAPAGGHDRNSQRRNRQRSRSAKLGGPAGQYSRRG